MLCIDTTDIVLCMLMICCIVMDQSVVDYFVYYTFYFTVLFIAPHCDMFHRIVFCCNQKIKVLILIYLFSP